MSAATSYERLREYTEHEYILIGDLRELLQDSKQDTSDWMLQTLDALMETLPLRFELKSSNGYLQDIIDEHPNYHPLVVRLEREHEELILRLAELKERVEAAAPFVALGDQIDADLRDWIKALTAHNRHEIRLIQTAANLEVGVGD